jgi:uncharacterized protein (DUF433 family)
MVREECSLRVLENWVLRRVIGSRRDEVTTDWTELNNEDLHQIIKYYDDQIEENKMGGTRSRLEK